MPSTRQASHVLYCYDAAAPQRPPTLELTGKTMKEEVMKRTAKIAAAVAGGALAAGAIAVPVAASAFGNGPGPGDRPGYHQVMNGAGGMAHDRVQARDGTGMMAQDQARARDGTGLAAGSRVAAGALTAAQRTELVRLAEEEKLNHDLYAALAKAYGLPVFENLAVAEANHLQALRTLMDRYGVADPTAGKAAGVFASATVQAAYDRLLAQGKTSQQAALGAAQTVEKNAIARYGDALGGLNAPAAERVYTNLRAAETRHLAAINTWLAR
jgi:hypothetical protein